MLFPTISKLIYVPVPLTTSTKGLEFSLILIVNLKLSSFSWFGVNESSINYLLPGWITPFDGLMEYLSSAPLSTPTMSILLFNDHSQGTSF